jgi:hypothetical protein
MPDAAAAPVADASDSSAPPPLKPFGAFLHEHRGAGLHNEAGEKLAEVVAAVIEHGKKGSLTLTINVEPQKGDGNLVIVTDEVKAKVPKAPSPASAFFSDDHGNLSRRDPRQPEITGLRDASEPGA